MPVNPDFRDFVVEQLGRVAPVSARPMFGGVGLYSDGFFFGLIDDDRIYLKVDDSNRGEFEAAGMGPFVYAEGQKRCSTMSYPKHSSKTRPALRRGSRKRFR